LTQVANAAYKRNIGGTHEQCCDKTCSAVKCPKGKKAGKCGRFQQFVDCCAAIDGVLVLEVPAALQKSAGKTVEDYQGRQICHDNE